ncbi:MAG: TolC family protein [Rickettsiales bacterium]|jgi:outer membrane protein TolC|nr:TolC family protein [Rickettsiales bacterium]
MIKKIFSVLVALCVLPAAAYADGCPELQPQKTLQEIVEIGLCRNPTTKMGYLSVESARLSKNAAYSKYLPSVSASAGANASSRDDFGSWGKSASISASYLIFDFGKRYSELSRLAAVWHATGFDYEQSVQNYVYSIVGAYYGLLIADAEVTTNENLMRVAADAKTTADKKFKAGAVAKADVLRAETTLASKKTDLERSRGTREIAVAKLLSLLSLPQGTAIRIKDMSAEFGNSAEIKDISELLETAKKQRPDLLAAAANVDAAWHARNIAFMQHLPTISATGGVTYDLNVDTRSSQIGVNISMPIFAGFANVYNDRIAMLNYERAQESERAKQDSAALDVWTAFHNYKTAGEVLASTSALLKSATESEKVVAGMYKVGRSTMLDWQSSQADLASAQRQNAAAKYDLFIKRAALAMAVGDLSDKVTE